MKERKRAIAPGTLDSCILFDRRAAFQNGCSRITGDTDQSCCIGRNRDFQCKLFALPQPSASNDSVNRLIFDPGMLQPTARIRPDHKPLKPADLRIKLDSGNAAIEPFPYGPQ